MLKGGNNVVSNSGGFSKKVTKSFFNKGVVLFLLTRTEKSVSAKL